MDLEIQRAVNITKETVSHLNNDQEKSAVQHWWLLTIPFCYPLELTARQQIHILRTSNRLQKAFPFPPLIAFHHPTT